MQSKILGGRYHIINELGSGAFGKTYLAEDRHRPGNPVCVVKQLIPQVVNQITLRLFNAEAEILEKLGNHDRIPRLFAHFQENQEFYLVQEFISGHNLEEELPPSQQWSEDRVIHLLREILEVLAFVHQQNAIHRDLKPENIRRRQDGKIVLIDFGAVKQIGTQVTNATISPISSNTISVGTPGYMPSEQRNGKPKFSSDVYAVGMIGIQALTGIYPYLLPEDADAEIIWRNRANVSSNLADILDKMVRYDFRQRYLSAVEALAAIMALVTPVSPSNRANLLDQCRLLVEFKRYEEAIKCYEDAIISQPNSHEAWYERGKTLYQLQRYSETLASCEKAVQIKPDYAEAWRYRGRALGKLQRYEEGLFACEKAIQIKSDYADAWFTKGVTLITLQRYTEAIAACDRAIEIKPDHAKAWFCKGLALYDLQRYTEAIAAYNRGIEIEPDDANAWFWKGWALYDLQRYTEAIAAYERAIEIKPDHANAWNRKGLALDNLQRYEEAIAAYDRAIQINPNHQLAIKNRQLALSQWKN